MPRHCGEPMIGIEYWYDHPEHYDGISEWKCDVCGLRIGRWSGRILVGDDSERRFDMDDFAFYMIRDKTTGEWYRRGPTWRDKWGPQKGASVWTDRRGPAAALSVITGMNRYAKTKREPEVIEVKVMQNDTES